MLSYTYIALYSIFSRINADEKQSLLLLMMIRLLPSLFMLVLLQKATFVDGLSTKYCASVTQSELDAQDTRGDHHRDRVSTSESCPSATTNVRGHYTSNYVPCDFSFHKSDVDDRTEFSTATVCGDDNNLLPTATIQQDIRSWPDECVGDHARCYSLEQDKSIYLTFLCLQDWTLPENTTHMSVNCTADKVALLQAQQPRDHDDVYAEEDREMMRNLQVFGFTMLGLLTLTCLICCVFGYFWIVKPYTKAVRVPMTNEADELMGAKDSSDEEVHIT